MEEAIKKNLNSLYTVSFFFLILLALFSKLYISFLSGLPWLCDDSYNYIKMADAILSGHPFSYFPNGLPILIAIIKLFFNSQIALTVLICLNIIFSTLTVWITTEITKEMTGSRLLALLSGLCIALYPNQINFVRQILTETPTTFLLTLGLLFLIRKQYFLSGFVIFLATMFRSTLLPLFPIIFICCLFYPGILSDKKRKIVKLLWGVGLGLALYLALLFSGMVKPSGNTAESLLISISSYSQNLNFRAPENFTVEQQQHSFHTYIDFMLNNPSEYIKQRLFSLQELWGWPSTSDPPRHLTVKILIFIHFPLLILAIIGFVKHIRDFDAWILFAPIINITLVHAATFSEARYTCTIEPCLIVLAVILFNRLHSFSSEWLKKHVFWVSRTIIAKSPGCLAQRGDL